MTVLLFHFSCEIQFSLKMTGTSICTQLTETLYPALEKTPLISEKVLLI